MDQCCTGGEAEESAVEQAMLQVAMMAHRAARKAVGRDGAADVAQDVILECLIKLRSREWSPPDAHSIRVFVLQVVRRRAIDFFKTRDRRAARELAYGREQEEWSKTLFLPDLETEEREIEALHALALEKLPRVCRRVYVMVFDEAATRRAAAEQLGISQRAVSAHVAAARRRLRQELAHVLLTA